MHLQASLIPKKFPGVIPPGPRLKREGDKKEREREKETREGVASWLLGERTPLVVAAVNLERMDHLASVVDRTNSLQLIGHISMADHQSVPIQPHCVVRISHVGRQAHRQPNVTSSRVLDQKPRTSAGDQNVPCSGDGQRPHTMSHLPAGPAARVAVVNVQKVVVVDHVQRFRTCNLHFVDTEKNLCKSN